MIRPFMIASLAVALFTLTVGQANADGDAAAGEVVFQKCMLCHIIEEGAVDPNKQGPNLFGVIGRTAGTHEGFEGRYSPALVEAIIVWDEVTLTEWLQGPTKMVRGVRMPFKLRKEEDIANVIAFLVANSPPPAE